ncbi:MAG: isoprenylcysteine carboxylmethyltransferase family protein [Betaproteobacteria bacterium]
MNDIPLTLLATTISAYWFGVGTLVVRLRRRTHRLVGLVPEQLSERLMWLVWVPLVAAWVALPWLAHRQRDPLFAIPDFALLPPYPVLRWIAAAIAVACLVLTVNCWVRMGRNWRMDTSAERPSEIITDGLFARIRHPIYAFSMLLVLCSAIIVPTLPMAVVAVVNIVLVNLKARNEERQLLASGGEEYARYLQRTGRFVPRQVAGCC